MKSGWAAAGTCGPGPCSASRPRRLVEPYVHLPQAASRTGDPLGFVFNEMNCSALYLYQGFTDASLADVRWFPEVTELRVSEGEVTDAGLAALRGLREGSGLDILSP